MNKVYLHTLTIRIWHWLNALIVILLLITGIQLRVPGIEILPKFSMAVLIHKYAGFAMAGSFLFWLLCVIVERSFLRNYLLRPADARSMGQQTFFYCLGIFRGEKNPFTPTAAGKFNPLQKIAYGSVMLIFTPVIVITGILFSDIFFFRRAIDLFSGIRVLDALHVITAYIFLLYLIVHIYMSTLGHNIFAHTKAMIVGYEEEPEEAHEEGGPHSPEVEGKG
jgi:thiosulfate reductase cytochrome b subunit